MVVAIQRDLIDSFGGSHGLRDEGLLEAALAQPMTTAGGRLLHRTKIEQGAAYLFHLCKNHAFVDGNKRIALAAMMVYLHINGYAVTMRDDELYDLVIGVADGSISKRDVISMLRRGTTRVP